MQKPLKKLKLLSVGITGHGIIAVGVSAHGIIAIGVAAHGLIAIGLVPMGLVSVGVVSMGLASAGVVSMGLVTVAPMGMSFIKHQKKEMPGMEMSAVERNFPDPMTINSQAAQSTLLPNFVTKTKIPTWSASDLEKPTLVCEPSKFCSI